MKRAVLLLVMTAGLPLGVERAAALDAMQKLCEAEIRTGSGRFGATQ